MENTMLTNLAEIKGNLDSLNDTFEKILNDLLSEKSKSPDEKNNSIIKNEIASAQRLYDELKQYPIQQRLKWCNLYRNYNGCPDESKMRAKKIFIKGRK